tara:strand:- start:911 stop:2287 length:1377 start_codon:yes stop_codon:yes gene_type:complete
MLREKFKLSNMVKGKSYRVFFKELYTFKEESIIIDRDTKIYRQRVPHNECTVELLMVYDLYAYMKVYNNEGMPIANTTFPAGHEFELLSKKEVIVYDKRVKDNTVKNLPTKLAHQGIGLTLGTDPEVFVKRGDDSILPAFNFLGSQDVPSKGPNRSNCNNNIFWDGFQAEFDVKFDACLAWVVDSIQGGLEGVLNHARKFDSSAKLSIDSVVKLTDMEMQGAEPQHLEFGCEPSLNAYHDTSSVPTIDGKDTNVRPAGGHIHFGVKDLNKDKIIPIIKSLDAVVGLACVSLFRDLDSPERRELYGKAGEYRIPAHGLEYRVLSNAWLCHPLITNFVFDLARRTFMLGHIDMKSQFKCSEAEVQRIINEGDHKTARRVLSRNKKVMRLLLNTNNCLDEKQIEFKYKMLLGGVSKYVKDPSDIESNWKLNKEWSTHCNGQDKNWYTAWGNFKQQKEYMVA